MKLQLQYASKRFNDLTILDDVSLTFTTGTIYGLKGDNGSGKTVLLKLLCGYLHLDKGEILQDKRNIGRKQQYIQHAGIVIENVQFLPHLTLWENLALLKRMSPIVTDEKIRYWIDYYQLEAYQNISYRKLSLGTKQKLALIQAFIHEPEVLLLDEPMNALDEKSVKLTEQVILQHKENRLVLLT